MEIEIIAELAQGFEGCLEQSKLLVKAAAKSGASAVKFQMVYADELATPDYIHYQLFKNLEMSDKEWREINSLCKELEIQLILDVFGEKSLYFAQQLEVKSIKVHATDITNYVFLDKIAKSRIKRVMLGAGGAYLDEIKQAIKALSGKEIVLFHGFQGYPTLIEENQISRLKVWEKLFCKEPKVKLGFSDHIDPNTTSSISVPAFAVGQGALILEKHLTLAACMELEDFESAMNPDQFKAFVECMRDLEKSHGSSSKNKSFDMSKNEKIYRDNIRRDVVAASNINSGEVICDKDVVLKRTSAKNALKSIAEVTGKKAIIKIKPNMPISGSDIH